MIIFVFLPLQLSRKYSSDFILLQRLWWESPEMFQKTIGVNTVRPPLLADYFQVLFSFM
jgi:hypothetical protein